jgi:hypothetical protein
MDAEPLDVDVQLEDFVDHQTNNLTVKFCDHANAMALTKIREKVIFGPLL